MRLAAATVVLLTGAAQAGPTARVGLTYGIADQGGPDEIKVGPMIALGDRLGPFVGELEYAYLSFFDPDASPGGVHRVGVTLRADLLHTAQLRKCAGAIAPDWTCATGHGLYVEAGAAERFGQWIVDATHITPLKSPQPEGHLGIGFEMDNRLGERRDGWQLALRFAVAPADQIASAACRATGGSCPTTMSGGGLDKSVYVEWMFLFGH
jgi:hypothetical protein